MSLLEIRTFPDPVLLRPAEDVTSIDGEVLRLVEDMAETMHFAGGVGLAAPQVGVPRRIIVVDTSAGEEPRALVALVNPVLLSAEGEEAAEEGCLSIPDFTVKVSRALRVKVQGIDSLGKPVTLEAEGLLARALQHEIDHTKGRLILDHLTGLKKEMARKRLRRQARETNT